MTPADDPAELLGRARRDRWRRLHSTSSTLRLLLAVVAIGVALNQLVMGGGSVAWLLVAGAGAWLAVTTLQSLAADDAETNR